MEDSKHTDSNNGRDELPFFSSGPFIRWEGGSGEAAMDANERVVTGAGRRRGARSHCQFDRGAGFFQPIQRERRSPAFPRRRCGLVLYDDGSSSSPQRFASSQAVLPHARQDHAQCDCAVHEGDRPEEHVDRRPAEIFTRPLVRGQQHAAVFFVHRYVKVAGRRSNLRRATQITRLKSPLSNTYFDAYRIARSPKK
jgi:hypothetical protein